MTFRPMTEEEMVEFGLAEPETPSLPADQIPIEPQQESDMPLSDRLRNTMLGVRNTFFTPESREMGYQLAKSGLKTTLGLAPAIAEGIDTGSSWTANRILEALGKEGDSTPVIPRVLGYSPTERINQWVDEFAPEKANTTEVGKATEKIAPYLAEAASLIGAGGAGKGSIKALRWLGEGLSAMPKIQLGAAGLGGLAEYAGINPEDAHNIEAGANVIGALRHVPRWLWYKTVGGLPNTMAAPGARAIMNELGPELETALPKTLKPETLAAINRGRELAGSSPLAKAGAEAQAAIAGKLDTLGQALEGPKAILSKVPLSAETSTQAVRGLGKYAREPLLKSGVTAPVMGEGANLATGEGIAYRKTLSADAAEEIYSGVKKAARSGRLGPQTNRLLNEAKALHEAVLREVSGSGNPEAIKALDDLVKGNQNYSDYLARGFTDKLTAKKGRFFKTKPHILADEALKDVESVNSLLEVGKELPEVTRYTKLSVISKLLHDSKGDLNALSKAMTGKSKELKALFGEEWETKIKEALTKGDNSLLGTMARSGMAGPFVISGALATAIGLSTGNEWKDKGIISGGAFIPTFLALNWARNRGLATIGTALIKSMDDPVLLKQLASTPTPELKRSFNNMMIELAATGERAGVKEIAKMSSKEEEKEPTKAPAIPEEKLATPLKKQFRPMTDEDLEKFGLKKKPMTEETPQPKAARISEIVDRYAEVDGVPKQLAHAVLRQESAGNPDAVSPKGAKGYMQVMPETFGDMKKDLGLQNGDINNPEHNIRAGIRYMRRLHERYNDWRLALAAYNWGMRKLDDAIALYGTRDWDVLGKKKGVPLETKNYVAKLQNKVNLV